MSENVIQASFASGELSPSLFARVDIAKYHSGAATMRNFFVDYRSGASTRSGTAFVRPCLVGSLAPVRLVRFQQSVDVTYVLEFGNSYLRFISNGDSIVEPVFSVSGVTLGVVTSISTVTTNFVTGDLIFVTGSSVRQMNNRYFVVGIVGGTTFRVQDPFSGADVNSSLWDTWVGGGTAARVYTIPTPYTADQLALLKFSQKASKLNITHPAHPPYVLTLINATNWTLAPQVFGATISSPTSLSVAASAAGTAHVLYSVTSVDSNGQEAPVAAFAFADNIVDLRTTSGSVQVVWNAVSGAQSYNVYKSNTSFIGLNGTEPLGFIGSSTSLFFVDSNISPDFATTPPIAPIDFPLNFENPGVSSYFQQRLTYANFGGNDVDRFIMSHPGVDQNFNISVPSEPDDEIDARLVSLEVNEIKSMIPMPSGLIMLTTRGVWQVSGGAGGVATQGGPITPSSLTATSQAYIGANDVPPILVNYDIYFVQQKGSIIRNLSYNIYANIFTGSDMSIMSSHLFYNHRILEWAYAEEPFKIIWAVREDGVLLSLTTIKEQEMAGWARHDTLGNFRSVCTVTEGTVDATYVVVDRPNADGNFIKMIERIADRTFQFGAEDAWAVDAGVTTGHNEPNALLFINLGNQGNVIGGPIDIQANTPGILSGAMIGWVLRALGGKALAISFTGGSETLHCTITQPFTGLIPNDPLMRANQAQPGTWSIDSPGTHVFGLSHLEGQRVSVLADGGVVNGLTVHNASITLPAPATNVTVGLGFQAQLQTMYLDLGQEVNTIQGKRKKIGALTVRVKDSRGLKAGRTFKTLIPIKELNRTTVLGQSIPLITADERIVMDPLWDVPGQICLQVDDPLPVTVLGVIPEVVIGDTTK